MMTCRPLDLIAERTRRQAIFILLQSFPPATPTTPRIYVVGQKELRLGKGAGQHFSHKITYFRRLNLQHYAFEIVTCDLVQTLMICERSPRNGQLAIDKSRDAVSLKAERLVFTSGLFLSDSACDLVR